jgi:hypothetical protein
MKLGYCRITKTRTKFFYKDFEFYIERDIPSATAEIVLRPDCLKDGREMALELLEMITREELRNENMSDPIISKAIESEVK